MGNKGVVPIQDKMVLFEWFGMCLEDKAALYRGKKSFKQGTRERGGLQKFGSNRCYM